MRRALKEWLERGRCQHQSNTRGVIADTNSEPDTINAHIHSHTCSVHTQALSKQIHSHKHTHSRKTQQTLYCETGSIHTRPIDTISVTKPLTPPPHQVRHPTNHPPSSPQSIQAHMHTHTQPLTKRRCLRKPGPQTLAQSQPHAPHMPEPVYECV